MSHRLAIWSLIRNLLHGLHLLGYQINFLVDGQPICYWLSTLVNFRYIFCLLESKNPMFTDQNFQLPVQEPRGQFHKNGYVRCSWILSYCFFSGENLHIFLYKSCRPVHVAEFPSRVSNSTLHIPDSFVTFFTLGRLHNSRQFVSQFACSFLVWVPN